METELLKVFDDNRNVIGEASRKDVHHKGYWHETFHCWLTKKEAGIDYIYFQLRSEQKKDYPNLLDITAAGHLLAHETVVDGIREVKEELGINISFDNLIPLGVIAYSMRTEAIVDNELANVFLLKYKGSFKEFHLQKEEVSGVFRARFSEFSDLIFGKIEEIVVEGFMIGKQPSIVKEDVGMYRFVPHQKEFYQEIIRLIEKEL
ncbi:NUDIX hydrolase [Anaerobacillus sp. CMMVII]|nr:NUDIX hydrolase [Anaerobacillus sp. CMMVII]